MTPEEIREQMSEEYKTYVRLSDGTGGLLLQEPLKGIGEKGVWFVFVDNFYRRVPCADVVSVEVSSRKWVGNVSG